MLHPLDDARQVSLCIMDVELPRSVTRHDSLLS
jgi:hypothetical protein